ncbi:hypothetical protein QUB56_31810 [Microcoleus sp. AR_TQ3_B6]|uniref:hypothetical protein n=1 Tax=Microcoleus sp. AR_TQ3_B6 TaxID=3055284 RepID=UPI002FD3EF92
MRIKGILATEAHKLSPEQWVNIYELSTYQAEFYDCCQVKDLDLDEPSEYGLELIEEGTFIEQGEAVK